MANVAFRRPCPVCGTLLEMRPVDREGPNVLLPCPGCDLQVWDPATSADAAWYDESDFYVALSIVDWLGWYHQHGLDNLPRDTKTLLDIGTAEGRFVHAAVLRGIDAYGIDHSQRLVDIGNGRYKDGRLSVRSIEQLYSMGRLYDAVTLFEVIEHVEEPFELLRSARTLLRPGGTLIVSTPNRLGRPHPPHAIDVPPNHLTRWSPRALTGALERAGFASVGIHYSPGRVGLQSFILDKTRSGLLVRLLRVRKAAGGGSSAANVDVRMAIRAKVGLASVVAAVLAPFLAPFFCGGSMIAFAKRPAGDPAIA